MRIRFSEISFSRIFNGFIRRIMSVPDKFLWAYSSTAKKNKKKIKLFKNSHYGEKCYLVANGPSLKKMDLGFLDNNISFGLNRIYLAYDSMNFTNDYLVSINNLVLTQFNHEIKTLQIPKFLNWKNRSLFKNCDDVFFINKSFFGSSFGKEIDVSLNPSATVTYAALQIIYYMGFSEVIIIGLDHNFITKTNNSPNKTELRTENVDVNHFHPNYFPKGSKWETPDLVSSEYFYRIAKNEFDKAGRKIVDCTVNGKCVVFEKGSLENFI